MEEAYFFGEVGVTMTRFNVLNFSCNLEAENMGCKDEKNTVRLYCHASDPANIRDAWHYKVSKA